MKDNSIKEWLARVAIETGSPLSMEAAGMLVKNTNTRKLIVEYAQYWAKRLDLRRRA